MERDIKYTFFDIYSIVCGANACEKKIYAIRVPTPNSKLLHGGTQRTAAAAHVNVCNFLSIAF